MKNIKWRIIVLLFLITSSVFSQVTITAVVTPATCTNNGTLEVILTGGPAGVTYGIVKAPFDVTKIVSSSTPVFTMLEPGLYYFGYYDGTTFVKAENPIQINNNYNSIPPSLSYGKKDYYAYCQGISDPLGTISANVRNGNPPIKLVY